MGQNQLMRLTPAEQQCLRDASLRWFGVRPRLFGSYRNGKLSFGALDPLLFDDSKKEPFKLPAFALDLEDGRGLIETDFGPVGLKAEGRGGLRNGFSGIVAAVAPQLAMQGCTAGRTSFYGKISIARAQPSHSVPPSR